MFERLSARRAHESAHAFITAAVEHYILSGMPEVRDERGAGSDVAVEYAVPEPLMPIVQAIAESGNVGRDEVVRRALIYYGDTH